MDFSAVCNTGTESLSLLIFCCPAFNLAVGEDQKLQHLSYKKKLRELGFLSLRRRGSGVWSWVCKTWSEGVGWTQTLLSGAQWKDKTPWALFEIQKLPFKHKIYFFMWKGDWAWPGCPKPLWNLHLWRCLKPDWTRCWASCCSRPCLEQWRGTRPSPEVPSNLQHAVDLVVQCALGWQEGPSWASNGAANKEGIICHSAQTELYLKYLLQRLLVLVTLCAELLV